MQSSGVTFQGSEQSTEAGSGPGGMKQHVGQGPHYSETPTLPHTSSECPSLPNNSLCLKSLVLFCSLNPTRPVTVGSGPCRGWFVLHSRLPGP